jgi:hypothetical protein
MLMTLYSTGIRRTELCRLQVTDIDSRRTMIHIRQGKGGHAPDSSSGKYSVGDSERQIDDLDSLVGVDDAFAPERVTNVGFFLRFPDFSTPLKASHQRIEEFDSSNLRCQSARRQTPLDQRRSALRSRPLAFKEIDALGRQSVSSLSSAAFF